MPELRVVAVSNDGTRLVLKAADSTEYTLPIDERLRAAVRGDRPRLGQIEIEVESHLRPRDIQARIRAGATAEEVAQFAGIPVDRVRRFEGPVLAERAFMAERARKTPVRRPGENSKPPAGRGGAGASRAARRRQGLRPVGLLAPGRRHLGSPARLPGRGRTALGELDVRPAPQARPGRGRRGALADRRVRRHRYARTHVPVRAAHRPAAQGPASRPPPRPRPGPAARAACAAHGAGARGDRAAA